MEIINKKTPINLILSTSQIAAFFGVTRWAIQKWLKAGCPKIKHGQLDLKAVFDWWFENIAESKIPDTERLQTLKAEHLIEKIKIERLKVAQLEGSMAAWDTIENEWVARVGVVTSGLNAFADRLPPILEGKGRVEMQSIIRKETWELRDAYCRKGKYTPAIKEKKRSIKQKRRIKAKTIKKKKVKNG